MPLLRLVVMASPLLLGHRARLLLVSRLYVLVLARLRMEKTLQQKMFLIVCIDHDAGAIDNDKPEWQSSETLKGRIY